MDEVEDGYRAFESTIRLLGIRDVECGLLREKLSTLSLKQGQVLFSVNDDDAEWFIVTSGTLKVFNVQQGKQSLFLDVKVGESVFSSISLLHALCGEPDKFAAIEAVAHTDVQLLRLQYTCFRLAFEADVEALVKFCQLGGHRIQLIFLTLEHFLGPTPIPQQDVMPESPVYEQFTEIPEAEVLLALNSFCDLFSCSVEDAHSLLHLRLVRQDEKLSAQGDVEHQSGLYYLFSGAIESYREQPFKRGSKTPVFSHLPGSMIGLAEALTNQPPGFTRIASSDSMLGYILLSDIYRLIEKSPMSLLNIALKACNMIGNSIYRTLDYALSVRRCEPGEVLVKDSSQTDTFLVVQGRLKSLVSLSKGRDEKHIFREFGKMEWVGWWSVITGTPINHLEAVRPSEVVRIPISTIDVIRRLFPAVIANLVKIYFQLYRGTLTDVTITNRSNIRTIALFPTTKEVPIVAFSLELERALEAHGTCRKLFSYTVVQHLGDKCFEPEMEHRLLYFMSHMEDCHRFLLLTCDKRMTKWTELCIREADVVLVLARSDSSHVLSPIEKHMLSYPGVRMELVLLHHENAKRIRGTRQRLKRRPFISYHIHVRLPLRDFQSIQQLSKCLRQTSLSEVALTDFGRLARHLTGTSIGLVLGGGGGRGCSHVGVINCLHDMGIPIDIIGGTSIGAMMGAMYSFECDLASFHARVKRLCKDADVKGCRQVFDLTWPYTSFMAGKVYNQVLRHHFEAGSTIEDLWIPFFAVSTDITDSCQRVHTKGPVWVYCRSTSTIAGINPPICDPVDGHLLLDGCYVNNVPADVMHRKMGADTVIAVDVGSEYDNHYTNYGQSLAGCWVFLKKLMNREIRVPSMLDIQTRLSFVSCVKKMEEITYSDYCFLLRPPVGNVGVLDFNQLHRLKNIGYSHAKLRLAGAAIDATTGKLVIPNSSPLSPVPPSSVRNVIVSMVKTTSDTDT